MYENLLYLKHYEGDVSDFCLYMCYTDTNFGEQKTINFIPGGSEVPVTNENKMQYVRHYANHILNKKDAA